VQAAAERIVESTEPLPKIVRILHDAMEAKLHLPQD
jgi:hypothetical protein